MNSSICSRDRRISKAASTRLRPARASSARRSGASSKLAERRRKAVGVARFDRHRAWPADLREAASPRGDKRGAARHRLERRAAERFGTGRQHHSDRGALPRRLDLGIGNVGIDPDPAVEGFGRVAKRPNSLRLPVGGHGVGHHEARAPFGPRAKSARDRRHRLDVALVPERPADAEDRRSLGFVADQACMSSPLGTAR